MRCSLAVLSALSISLTFAIPTRPCLSAKREVEAVESVDEVAFDEDALAERSTTGRIPITGLSNFTSGIAYSHYNANSQCRSRAAVNTDVKALIALGHDLIRIYGVDCNGPMNVAAAVKGTNTSMFLGIYDISQADAQARSIAAQLGNNWSNVHTISVGNEVVNNGGDPAAVIAAMNTARKTLRSLGYNGPVVTTDTMVAVMNHPELCTAADYCAMNCHAFFDGNFSADQAGSFVQMFINIIRGKIGASKSIVITESGWPHAGNANGKAVPGQQQQQTAMASLKKAVPKNLILYSAFNEYWLKNTLFTFNAENNWGVYGDSPGGR